MGKRYHVAAGTCPACGSVNTADFGHTDFGDDVQTQSAQCRVCKFTWKEVVDTFFAGVDIDGKFYPTKSLRTIKIEIRGGCLVDVSGLPDGWRYKLIDWDDREEERTKKRS